MARILLVGITDQAVKVSEHIVPRGALVVVVTDDHVCQVLVSLKGSHKSLKPGMSIGLGENLEFYYYGRRLRLLPSDSYRIDGEIYGRKPLSITPAWRPQDDRPDHLGQPARLATTARAIFELYGPLGLLACLAAGTIRQLRKVVRPA
jgi:hypothetical protein